MDEKPITIKPRVLTFLTQVYCPKRNSANLLRLVRWAVENDQKIDQFITRYSKLTHHEQRKFMRLCIKDTPDNAIQLVEKIDALASAAAQGGVTFKTKN